MSNRGYIYFLTNKTNNVIYVGVTNDLKRRIYEHRLKQVEGFTRTYNLSKLVYYEMFNTVPDAIAREKQIKGGSRQKKLDLILKNNPEFSDLYDMI